MPTEPIPTPSSVVRDDEGRVVHLCLSPIPVPPEIDGETWLLCSDGSTHAQRAVEEAIRLVRGMPTGRLALLHVEPWLSKEAAEHELAERSWRATASARAALSGAGLTVPLHALMHGDPATAICDFARAVRARGIIIGSRGLGATANLLLGSVASKVIQSSTLPVLITGAQCAPR